MTGPLPPHGRLRGESQLQPDPAPTVGGYWRVPNQIQDLPGAASLFLMLCLSIKYTFFLKIVNKISAFFGYIHETVILS